MKNLIGSFFVFLIVLSCNKEDNSLFENFDKSIQNEGYLPLAQDNSWKYETYKALKLKNGEYAYTNEKKTSNLFVTNIIALKGDSTPRFDYLLSPVDVGSFLGGILGASNQVSKTNGEYRTKQSISFEDSDFNGKEKKGNKFELKESPFLVDNPTVGQILYEKDDSFTSPDGAFKLEYKKITVVKNILPEIPANLASQIGIDDHLKQYKDILHISDSILIKKIIVTEKAGNTIAIDAEVNILPADGDNIDDPTIVGGRQIININSFGSKIKSITEVLGFGVAEVKGYNMRTFNVFNVQSTCELKGPIKINTILKGGEINLIPNATDSTPLPYYSSDTYWAKGVGNIKTVNKFYDIPISVNISDYLVTDTFRVELRRVDPACGEVGAPDTVALELSLQINTIEDIKVEVPVSTSKFIYVQNLVNSTKRKTLN